MIMSKQIASKPQTIVADAERMLAELVAHCSMNACANQSAATLLVGVEL